MCLEGIIEGLKLRNAREGIEYVVVTTNKFSSFHTWPKIFVLPL